MIIRIDRHARQPRAFMQRDAELGVGGQQLRVDVVEVLRRVQRRARRRIIGDVLIVDGLVVHVRPGRLAHGLPVTECLQAPIEQELRFVLLARYRRDHVLVQSGRQAVGFDVRDESVPVLLIDQGFYVLSFGRHEYFQ